MMMRAVGLLVFGLVVISCRGQSAACFDAVQASADASDVGPSIIEAFDVCAGQAKDLAKCAAIAASVQASFQNATTLLGQAAKYCNMPPTTAVCRGNVTQVIKTVALVTPVIAAQFSVCSLGNDFQCATALSYASTVANKLGSQSNDALIACIGDERKY